MHRLYQETRETPGVNYRVGEFSLTSFGRYLYCSLVRQQLTQQKDGQITCR
jgi:hypothetical protein